MSRLLKTLMMTVFEWCLLVTCWMLFVSQWKKDELLIGIGVATVGTIADWIVKMEGLAKFRPKVAWLALITWEPWYVLQGTWTTIKVFGKRLAGKRLNSRFRVSRFHAVGDDERRGGQETLAVAYLTIPPNSIVIGIDDRRQEMLTHLLAPEPTPLMAKKLGVK